MAINACETEYSYEERVNNIDVDMSCTLSWQMTSEKSFGSGRHLSLNQS